MKVTFEPVEVTRDEVPTAYGPRVEKKLKAMAKRLAKLGAPAPTVEFGPVVNLPYDEDTARNMGWSGDPFPRPTYAAYETVTVTGYETKLDGWTGVAVLDWTVNPDEAFVVRFPGHDEDNAPEVSDELRTRGAVCDHCSTKRRRNNTVVFTHDDGRTVAVGTGCVLEYLGVDPRTVLMLSDFVRSLDDDDGPAAAPSMDPVEFVALAAEVTRFFGFVRSGNPDSTKDLTVKVGVTGLTTSSADRDLARELADALDMGRGRAKAEAVVAWVNAETNPSDFLRSAKVALTGYPVEAGSRSAGLLAALPFSHDRHLGLVAERDAKRKAEAEARKTGEFVGTVGDKLTVKGTVTFYNTYDGMYGTSARLTMVTDDGNRVTTYGSGNTLFGWDVGDNVEVTGKVKAHDDDDRFGKSTVLERVKAKELDADGNPLPECSFARCARPGLACDTCGTLACANGHGRHYRDDFLCDGCLELAWDDEERRAKIARAMCVAARSMLGRGPNRLGYNPTLRPADVDKMVPA